MIPQKTSINARYWRRAATAALLAFVSNPHPNCGTPFFDFFLGNEVPKIIPDTSEFVTRKGLVPPIKAAEKSKRIGMKELSPQELAKKKEELPEDLF